MDDDEAARDSLCALVSSMGLRASKFPSAGEFLAKCGDNPAGCLVTDYRMTPVNGLELQQELEARGIKMPVIIITAYATASLAVQAMQRGAVTLLEKPCDDQLLAETIRQALLLDARRRREDELRTDCITRLARLSPKERQVMEMMMTGKSNKLIAIELGLHTRTVESRRHRVFKKTKTTSMAELIRLVLRAEGEPS